MNKNPKKPPKKPPEKQKRGRNSVGLGLMAKYILVANARKESYTIICRLSYLEKEVEISTGIRIARKEDFIREARSIELVYLRSKDRIISAS